MAFLHMKNIAAINIATILASLVFFFGESSFAKDATKTVERLGQDGHGILPKPKNLPLDFELDHKNEVNTHTTDKQQDTP